MEFSIAKLGVFEGNSYSKENCLGRIIRLWRGIIRG